MTKTHHFHDRSVEHAKSRDTEAHKFTSRAHPGKEFRSTRGFPTADVVDGKTVQAQPALDIQPRHGGKVKGGVIAHSWGNTPQQIARENLTHAVIDAVGGAPDASSANPLDLMTSSQAGKRLPIPECHPHMKGDPLRGSIDSNLAGKMFGEAIISGSDKLPAAVSEES